MDDEGDCTIIGLPELLDGGQHARILAANGNGEQVYLCAEVEQVRLLHASHQGKTHRYIGTRYRRMFGPPIIWIESISKKS